MTAVRQDIPVTAAHIAAGVPGVTGSAVALAVADAFPGGQPAVGLLAVCVIICGRRRYLPAPPEVREAIRAIDGGEAVAPFTFTLEYTQAGAAA